MDATVTVQEVTDRTYVGVSESDGLRETAELLLEEGVDCAVVVRGDEPVGVLTERDALESFVGGEGDASVAEAMTDTVPTVRPDVTIAEAADELSSQSTKRLVVTDGDQPLGVLSEHDLITTSPFAPERRDVEAEPDAAVVGRPDDRAESGASVDRAYEDQSICEACGALSRDLSQFNGQLLCADCRDI